MEKDTDSRGLLSWCGWWDRDRSLPASAGILLSGLPVQAAEVGLGHKGRETFQLLEPYRVSLLILQEENEQQEPLQKRREEEVKERAKTVLELKNLLEQQQLGQAKER